MSFGLVRRASVVLAVGIIATVAFTWGADKLGPNFLTALQAVAALSLLLVTWTYARTTRDMAVLQRHQHEAAALEKVWRLSIDAASAMNNVRRGVRRVLAKKASLAAREDSLSAVVDANALLAEAHEELFRTAPTLANGLSKDAMRTVTTLRNVWSGVEDFVSLTAQEISRAKATATGFRPEIIAAGWENSPDSGFARWGEVAAGTFLDAAMQETADFGGKAATILEERGNSASAA